MSAVYFSSQLIQRLGLKRCWSLTVLLSLGSWPYPGEGVAHGTPEVPAGSRGPRNCPGPHHPAAPWPGRVGAGQRVPPVTPHPALFSSEGSCDQLLISFSKGKERNSPSGETSKQKQPASKTRTKSLSGSCGLEPHSWASWHRITFGTSPWGWRMEQDLPLPTPGSLNQPQTP